MAPPSFDASTTFSKALSWFQEYKAALLTAFSLPLLYTAYCDYSGWYGMGAGGFPHNVFGWFVQNLLRLRATRDKRSTACYDSLKVTSPLEQKSFLDFDLPKRDSPRASAWVVPHRQLEGFASEKLRESLRDAIVEVASSMKRWIETGPSRLEGGVIALYIKPEVASATAKRVCSPRSPREVFHCHETSEGSSHAYLTATDAAIVIDSGWGERHGLSGRALGLPLNYTMIFAPRNEDEVAIVASIAKAAAFYCLGGYP